MKEAPQKNTWYETAAAILLTILSVRGAVALGQDINTLIALFFPTPATSPEPEISRSSKFESPAPTPEYPYPFDLDKQTGLIARLGTDQVHILIYQKKDEQGRIVTRFGRYCEGASAIRFEITRPDGTQWTEGEFGGWERTSEPTDHWEPLKFFEDKFQDQSGFYKIDTVCRVDPGWDSEGGQPTNDYHLPLWIHTDGQGNFTFAWGITDAHTNPPIDFWPMPTPQLTPEN